MAVQYLISYDKKCYGFRDSSCANETAELTKSIKSVSGGTPFTKIFVSQTGVAIVIIWSIVRNKKYTSENLMSPLGFTYLY